MEKPFRTHDGNDFMLVRRWFESGVEGRWLTAPTVQTNSARMQRFNASLFYEYFILDAHANLYRIAGRTDDIAFEVMALDKTTEFAAAGRGV